MILMLVFDKHEYHPLLLPHLVLINRFHAVRNTAQTLFWRQNNLRWWLPALHAGG